MFWFCYRALCIKSLQHLKDWQGERFVLLKTVVLFSRIRHFGGQSISLSHFLPILLSINFILRLPPQSNHIPSHLNFPWSMLTSTSNTPHYCPLSKYLILDISFALFNPFFYFWQNTILNPQSPSFSLSTRTESNLAYSKAKSYFIW